MSEENNSLASAHPQDTIDYSFRPRKMERPEGQEMTNFNYKSERPGIDQKAGVGHVTTQPNTFTVAPSCQWPSTSVVNYILVFGQYSAYLALSTYLLGSCLIS